MSAGLASAAELDDELPLLLAGAELEELGSAGAVPAPEEGAGGPVESEDGFS